MDGVLVLVLIIAIFALPLAALDGATLRWGVDSREPMTDDHAR